LIPCSDPPGAGKFCPGCATACFDLRQIRFEFLPDLVLLLAEREICHGGKYIAGVKFKNPIKNKLIPP
jgi:hypothetical protein